MSQIRRDFFSPFVFSDLDFTDFDGLLDSRFFDVLDSFSSDWHLLSKTWVR